MQPDPEGPVPSPLLASALSTGPKVPPRTEPRIGIWEGRWAGEGNSMSFQVLSPQPPA